MTDDAEVIYHTWTDQNTIVLHSEPEIDDAPLAVLCGGATGRMSNIVKECPSHHERSLFWRGVIEGVKHSQNVLRHQDILGADSGDDIEASPRLIASPSIAEMKVLADLTVRLVEIRQRGCNHLAVENNGPHIFEKLIRWRHFSNLR